ncbi:hypothetical protein NFI96_009864 [Prochilodus magdalenae]|nr:hypothetical protein NFI96_009864 [Prochilodus magdalenae]
MFRKAATYGNTTDLEEYTLSVVHALLKAQDSAFKAGDKAALRNARAKLSRAINDKYQLYETRIILLGSRDAGKSSAGNTILNREESELKKTVQCVKRQGEVAGRHITVVEVPG